MRPSREIWAAPVRPSGAATVLTCGWAAIRSTDARIAAADAGSRTVPSDAVKTTVAGSPDAAGNRASSRSRACWDGVPGTEKSSTNSPPIVDANAPVRTTPASATASARFQWAAATRPSRSRSRDTTRAP